MRLGKASKAPNEQTSAYTDPSDAQTRRIAFDFTVLRWPAGASAERFRKWRAELQAETGAARELQL